MRIRQTRSVTSFFEKTQKTPRREIEKAFRKDTDRRRQSMNEGTRHNLTRGPDGHLHWNDVRNDLYSEHERKQTDYLVKFIGSMITRRKILGLTQEEVAVRAGIKQSAIARLENGKTVPRLDTLFRVAEALDLEIDIHPKSHGKEEQSATLLAQV